MSYPNNITVCLYTSAKGHFDRKDLYQRTVTSLLSQIPSTSWGGLIGHIKWDATKGAAEAEQVKEMGQWLAAQGFTPIVSAGSWKHGDDSHQLGYLQDCMTVLGKVTTPYVLHLEDDFLLRAYDHSVEYWLAQATSILDIQPGITQVRISRFNDEFIRINGLKAKHNIDGRAVQGIMENRWFEQNAYANHPSIMRTRDLRAALTFVAKTNLPRHSEHGTGQAMALLAWSDLPFICLNPAMIRCGHIGVATPAEEDNLDLPLMAN